MNNPTIPISNDSVFLRKVETASVYDAAGEKLGYIDDMVFDMHSGQVRYVVLGVADAFLDTGTARYPMPWSLIKYNSKTEGFVFPFKKANLERAPRYDAANLPAFTADYRQLINTYYSAYADSQ